MDKKLTIFYQLIFWLIINAFFANTYATTEIKHPKKEITTLHKKTMPVKKKLITKKQKKPQTMSALPAYLLTSIEEKLVAFIRGTISTLNYTRYRLGGNKFDTERGVYVVDCSAYIDHILKTISPHAFKSLKNWSKKERPTSHDYYQYFSNLSDNTTHWNTIDKASALRPGDVIVFRYQEKATKEIMGHVMIVMDKPKQAGNIFSVRIADSAPIAHSKDTRPKSSSGVGIGTMLLKIDPKTHLPYAYAWKIGSQFKKNVNIAMARPKN